ncbi:MAG TPA: tetratricopeptide repeat protein [Bacillaceae bacterium]
MGELKKAIRLRSEGRLEEANVLLVELAAREQGNAYIQYQCAWSFDVLGKEAEAVPFYQTALRLGLKDDEDAQGAYLGLGSTYRTLGDYENSRKVLEEGISRFPNHWGLKVFYAMTLYNLDDHKGAMDLLLKGLAQTSMDPSISPYKKAIEFYADKLDEVWK